jgi:histidine triad (HIT) family protein
MTGLDCAFCRVISGESHAQVVLADSDSVAFLDHRPLFPGHCLLAPRRHHETLGDLPEALIQPLFTNAQRLARAVEVATGAEGTFVAINNRVSQSVPHLHIHVVPRRRKDGLRGFFWPRQKYESDEQVQTVAEAIRSALANPPPPRSR